MPPPVAPQPPQSPTEQAAGLCDDVGQGLGEGEAQAEATAVGQA